MYPLANFSSVWIVLATATREPGEAWCPVRLAAASMLGNGTREILVTDLSEMSPPYPIGSRCLIVTIDADQLASCHLARGWPLPERIVDLLLEWRCATNGRRNIAVGGLAGALIWYGIPTAGALDFGASPKQLLSRLRATEQLFTAMHRQLDLGRALLRGRYLCAVARMEAVGVPIDRDKLGRLRAEWRRILDQVVADVDRSFGVYRGRRLDVGSFVALLVRSRIDWPTTVSGAPDLSDEAFREMARLHTELSPLRELRSTILDFDPAAVVVGNDGRNRVPLRSFLSKTGRNQPSAKASIFGCPAWVRRMIRAEPGTGIALIDWEKQEFGTAAALSDDGAMQAAYRSGDPYLALAIAAGAVPDGSTVASHPHERERCKRAALGVQYGIGKTRLARQLGTSDSCAAALIAGHKSAFPKFWAWADQVESRALLDREMRSVFGWRLLVDTETKPGTIRNFPMQANGAEMLRLACCMMTEAGIRVCATNHDAIMIEATLSDFDDTVAEAQRIMAEASATVLDGFTLRTSVRIAKAPDRWTEPRGGTIWAAVEHALERRTCSIE